MNTITINGLHSNSTVITSESLSNIGQYIPSTNVFIVTDTNVKNHLGHLFPSFPCYTVEAGEGSKSLDMTGKICKWLLEQGADRSSFILGVGGGVVCDLAGFVASTYMRGIQFGFVATSLLAQVDASVGGKNGVNLDGYKNIIGTFNQPKFVICDIEALGTLPKEEFSNGFAEIVKHTLIADAQMFQYIECQLESLKQFNPLLLQELVAHSVSIKAQIVQADEREAGERKKLNLGHTWGHAVEKTTGLPHGRSVSIGLEFAARLSEKKGLLSHRDYMRIINVLLDLGLPICLNRSPKKVFEALLMDKKKSSDSVDFILMKGIGEVVIEKITFDEILEFIEG
jgi:3-dehydroquinate synthase